MQRKGAGPDQAAREHRREHERSKRGRRIQGVKVTVVIYYRSLDA